MNLFARSYTRSSPAGYAFASSERVHTPLAGLCPTLTHSHSSHHQTEYRFGLSRGGLLSPAPLG